MNEMFCFQCQQTAHNTGCTGKAGVCGKKADTANNQDDLIGALIALACTDRRSERTDELILKGLFTTITNVNFNNDTILMLKNEIEQACKALSHTFTPYDMSKIWNADEDTRSLKSLLLFGIKGMAAYAYHARVLNRIDDIVNRFFYEALKALGEPLPADALLALVLKTGEVNLRCMKLLDEANTAAFGDPVPTQVPLTIEKGPFIVVSGHDLHDMKLLLEQTKDRGVNIYTHSEMLPAHGYPELKKHPHLKGNFGTGWQNQQTEFHNIPAPILFTTNCLMPVRQSYSDRVFTTSVVSYPELQHIGEDKDFTPVIEKALECGKYRINDLDLGEIDGLPRILDCGQCNDAYSAIKIAFALSEAFDCTVNDLPLTLVLSWYEQKAVCILLTLLYLGIQNMYLGPTIPAFISENVLQVLQKNYNLTPTSEPEKDLNAILQMNH